MASTRLAVQRVVKPGTENWFRQRNKKILDDDQVTIAEALKSSGYRTCHVGKWHLGKDPTTQGFDVNVAGREWGSPSGGGYRSPYQYPNCVQEKKGEYLTDRLATEALAFIEESKDQPFFMNFATYSVHSPITAKPELKAKYKDLPSSEAHNNPAYAAMIHSLDENVGRILDKLDELDLAKNTLVLFSSDNGGVWPTSKQWPLRAGKGSYYEGGIREPMIVRWPGKIEANSRCDVAVSGIDFFPTLLEATGTIAPEGRALDGVSLLPLLTQTGNLKARPLFWHFPIYLQGGSVETGDPKFRTRPGSVVRYGDWKLHEYFENGALELYNLKEDIKEQNNVALQEPETTKKLHGLLKTWRKQTLAPVPKELNPKWKQPAKQLGNKQSTNHKQKPTTNERPSNPFYVNNTDGGGGEVAGIDDQADIPSETDYYDPHPFGIETKYALKADNVAIGQWWRPHPDEKQKGMRKWIRARPRDKVLAFALYTHDHSVLKLTAQCFPLLPDEPKTAVLEFKRNGAWETVQEQTVQYPGWSLHFRVEDWDNTKEVP